MALPHPDVLANRFKEAEFAADLFAVDAAHHGAEDCQRRIWRGNDSIRIETYGWHALPWQSAGLSGQLQC